ncbi:MAG: PASTA domain-containing protein, partial [Solirubrobacterales bacterium]|nr:PASTA domain-containing protein [Solirubrobacterales bacterium]
LALAGQDRLQPLALAITSVANSSTASGPAAILTGTAAAGSGIRSLIVSGQTVPVGSGGVWNARVPLGPGPNLITALAIDGAGATAQAHVTVVYHVPASSPPAAVICKVPQTKGKKLADAKKALRRAHCRVGRIKQVRSRKVRRGRVVSTNPRAGRKLRGGAKVELFVSKGA